MTTASDMFHPDEARQIYPIGQVKHAESGPTIEIRAPFRAGLKHLDQFSHVMVFWWADQSDRPEIRQTLVEDLPYAPGIRAGVFACRTPQRPNPIAITLCPIIAIDEEAGTLLLAWVDAFDGTPVIDLKPFVPLSDRPRDVQVATWFAEWPTWTEDAADFDFAAHGLGED